MKIKIPDLQNIRRPILERVVNNHFYRMVHKKEEGTYHQYWKTNKGNAWIPHPWERLAPPLNSWINKEQRIHDRSKIAHRKPPVNASWQFPLFYYICKKEKRKGPDQLSLVSINQPYRKAMINNKCNYQDNHQSYSSRPDAVGNTFF